MAAIKFLTTVARSVHHALFNDPGVLKQICESIIIPNLQVRAGRLLRLAAGWLPADLCCRRRPSHPGRQCRRSTSTAPAATSARASPPRLPPAARQVREEDEEVFEMNPIEYIRRDAEGSDSDTRRRAAADLVKSLTEKYPEQVTQLCTGYVQVRRAGCLAAWLPGWAAGSVWLPARATPHSTCPLQPGSGARPA